MPAVDNMHVARLRAAVVQARLDGRSDAEILAAEPDDVRQIVREYARSSMQIVEHEAQAVAAAGSQEARHDALAAIPEKRRPAVERRARAIFAARQKGGD